MKKVHFGETNIDNHVDTHSHQVDNNMRRFHNMIIDPPTDNYNINSIEDHVTALQIDNKLSNVDTIFLILDHRRYH